MSQTKEI